MERGFPLIVFFEKKKGLGLKNFFWLGFTPVPYPELFWGQYTSLGFQTQTPIDFWCKLSSLFVVAGPQWQSFEQFRMQNNQQFPGLCPWTPLRRAYSPPPPPPPPDSPTTQRFFSSLCLLKNQHTEKNCWIRCCTPSKAEQPLWGVDLQKKEVKKD